MKRLVIALGGNALGSNPQEQLELVKHTAKTIVNLSNEGYNIVVTHGNGPQVGMINLAMDFAANKGANTPSMPFAECGSMSQGYIGYHLQQSIENELKSRKVDKNVATVITQVIVDKNDEAFKYLTKPVGMFYTKEESEKKAKSILASGRTAAGILGDPVSCRDYRFDAGHASLCSKVSESGYEPCFRNELYRCGK